MQKTADRLYDEDFYLWTQVQAQALRALAAERWNGPLDLERLAEEVEDLGNERRFAIMSQLIRVMLHCLKLAYSPAEAPRRGWMDSIDEARDEIGHRLTRSLRRAVEPELERLYAKARKRAQRALEAYGEPAALPESCPFTFDQLIADDWYLEPVSPSPGRP